MLWTLCFLLLARADAQTHPTGVSAAPTHTVTDAAATRPEQGSTRVAEEDEPLEVEGPDPLKTDLASEWLFRRGPCRPLRDFTPPFLGQASTPHVLRC